MSGILPDNYAKIAMSLLARDFPLAQPLSQRSQFEIIGRTRPIYGGQKTCLKPLRHSKYMPHQGRKEIARRLRQAAKAVAE